MYMDREQERRRKASENHEKETQRVIPLIDSLIQSDPRMSETKEFTLDTSHIQVNEAAIKAAAYRITQDKSKGYHVSYKREDDFITVKPTAKIEPSFEVAQELNKLIVKLNEIDDIKEYIHGNKRIIRDMDDNHIFTITIE